MRWSLTLLVVLLAVQGSKSSVFDAINNAATTASNAIENVGNRVENITNTLGKVFDFDKNLASSPGINPVTMKTARALRYALLPDEAQGGPTVFQSLSNLSNGVVVKIYQTEPSHFVISFGMQSPPSGSMQQQSGSAPIPFLSSLVPGAQAPTEAVSAFGQLHNGNSTEGSLSAAIRAMIQPGQAIAAVTCTGDGAQAGQLALLCGPWAALQIPESQISVITFGASYVGFNERFSWTLYRFVTLKYLWPFTANTIQGGSPITLQTPPPDTVKALSNAITKESLQQGLITIPKLLPPAQNTQLGAPPTPVNPQPEPCPFILCKTKPFVTADCLGFTENPTGINNSAIPPQYKTITVNGTSGSGNSIVIGWDNSTSTALFLWASTDSKLDWLSNAIFFNKGSFEPNQQLAKLIPGAEVHQGFLNLFLAQASPEQTSSQAQNLTSVLGQLSGGQTPTRVISTGHSLGAALAALTGVWASTTWPSATVVVITIGQPKAGNQAFVDLLTATVGLEYRYVYEKDVVPDLPPDAGYVQAPGGLWITNGTILMEDRPDMDVKDLTWDDHHCVGGYEPAVRTNTTVYVPGYVNNQAKPQGSSTGGGRKLLKM